MNQKEIDDLSEALRGQGLTWNQTNFAVSLVRNMQEQEREECARVCDRHEENQARHGDMGAAEQSRQDALAIRARSNALGNRLAATGGREGEKG